LFVQKNTAPSAIYQDIRNPPVAINIIDFIPRAQSLLPPSMSPPSLLRARVSTRASSRSGLSNRVGLSFEGLELQPIELLGRRVDGLPPLSVDFTWPGSLLKELAALVPGLGDVLGAGKTANDDAPGYFDVEYLDDELLIIRQQAPGGVFALVKVDSCDPKVFRVHITIHEHDSYDIFILSAFILMSVGVCNCH
jgi:hypothetical protein